MIALIKSEFLKLKTVRSTYVISIVALLLIGFSAAYVMGYSSYQYPLEDMQGFGNVSVNSTITGLASMMSIFSVIIAMLLIVHEYQHKTIAYTLISARSRARAYVAKVVTIFGFTTCFSVIMMAIGFGLFLLGVSMTGQDVSFDYSTAWVALVQAAVGTMVYTAYAVGLAFLFRSMTMAITVLFVTPIIVESIIISAKPGLANFVPFSLQTKLLTDNYILPGNSVDTSTLGAVVLLLCCYAGLALAIGAYSFVKRDVN